jgi:Rps23 Pro-64 3,4-dihydroxylase Tpa1-like proline 4-hydroxylase
MNLRSDELARAWAEATPFPHVVIDDFMTDVDVLALLDDEGVERYESELALFEASAPEPTTDSFKQLRDRFARELSPILSRVTGKQVRGVDMRAYAYRAGNYLLPHTDHREGLARQLAYAWYLPTPEPPSGGELELFRCTISNREITSVESACLISPQPHRLVVFDVNDASLHQVREVLSGARLSLAGWFYP